ncbi:MAG: DUF779 domain-containing protein [Methylotenera sp.]|nr:DUF779 domain-containing protein [Methylotenera sp.]
MANRVSATPQALELIHKLTAEHGAIVFFQSGGCCEGSVPLCLPANEFKPSASDVLIGEIDGAIYYMSDSHFSFAENMHTIINAEPGSSGSFSLDCGSGLAFFTSARLYNDEELATLAPVKRVGY